MTNSLTVKSFKGSKMSLLTIRKKQGGNRVKKYKYESWRDIFDASVKVLCLGSLSRVFIAFYLSVMNIS